MTIKNSVRFLNSEVELSKYVIFYKIAVGHYKICLKLASERKRIEKLKNNINELFHNEEKIDRASIITIIFSALALEGFINYYAFKYYSHSYFKKHFDKIGTVIKWVILLQKITGKKVDIGEKRYKDLKDLFILRNKLVHSKTIQKKFKEIKSGDFLKETDAEKALKTTQNMFNFLKEKDIIWMKIINAQYNATLV